MAAGLVLALVSAWAEAARLLVWSLDGLLAIVVVVDFLRTPAPRRALVDRSVPERVGLSRSFERAIVVEHPRGAGLALSLSEELPAAFEVAPPAPAQPGAAEDEEHARFDEHGRARFERRYRSRRRGVFELGAVRLRIASPWGLLEREARLEGRQPVAVEPALLDLGKTLALAASDRWMDLGVRRMRRRGGERDFESLREYVPGDDVRRLDWKAFARRGKPMVRQYQVERGQELLLLVDCGRRMRATVAQDAGRDAGAAAGWTKLDWALDAALQIAAVALSKGDRVGAAAFESGLLAYVAPARGARQLSRLSERLFGLQPSVVEGDLARALRELAVRHRRSATVLVLSDVADPLSTEPQKEALATASRRHRVVFAALDDPDLRAAADGRPVGERPVPAAVRAVALEHVEERARSLDQLRASGARVLAALPSEAAGPLLAAWLEERSRA